jgi:hypothetical protein
MFALSDADFCSLHDLSADEFAFITSTPIKPDEDSSDGDGMQLCTLPLTSAHPTFRPTTSLMRFSPQQQERSQRKTRVVQPTAALVYASACFHLTSGQ